MIVQKESVLGVTESPTLAVVRPTSGSEYLEYQEQTVSGVLGLCLLFGVSFMAFARMGYSRWGTFCHVHTPFYKIPLKPLLIC